MERKRPKRTRIRQRVTLGGLGADGFADSAAVLYRAAPGYWEQFRRERKRVVLPAPYKPNPKDWPDTGLHAAWLGHTTVLMKIDGTTLLTDPVLGEYCGVSLGLGTIGIKRLVYPALTVEELPHIDYILLSHAHMDHFDTPTLRKLWSRKTTVVTAKQTADLLRVRRYGRVYELGWGQKTHEGPAVVRAIEVNHWGARYRTDNYRGFNGYVIEAGKHRVLFGGDTAATDAFKTVRSAGPVDLAIMPIGAYNPWIRYHCTPEQAWHMAQDAGAEHFLPVHHQTFSLSREPVKEPIERLLDVAGASADRVAVREIGQEWSLR